MTTRTNSTAATEVARGAAPRMAVALEVAGLAAAARAATWLALEEQLSAVTLEAPLLPVALAGAAGLALGLLASLPVQRGRALLALVGAGAVAATQFGTTIGTGAAGAWLEEGGAVDGTRVICACAVAVLLGARVLLPVLRLRWHIGLVGMASALALLLCMRVADRATELRPTFERWHVVTSVLESPAHYRVLVSHPERPVALGTFSPSRSTRQNGGPRPALVMAPPARVRLEIPYEWSDAGAKLDLAAGIEEDAWKDVGARRGIVFRARVAGEVVFERVLVRKDYSGPPLDGSTIEREWHEGTIPLSGVDEVILEVDTTDGSAVPESLECGFANLLVLESGTGQRVLSSRAAPNVVFVVIDTMRADGFDPAPKGRTPNMAALAARGTHFERAFASSSWTWPSTASLMTTLTPLEHGVLDNESNYLSERWLTLPEHLQSKGFTTAAWSMNPLVSRAKNFDQGFETFVETEWERASTVSSAVCNWLAEHRRHRFMLYLQFTDPHGPYDPPKDVRDEFKIVDPPGYGDEALELLQRKAKDRTALERDLWPVWVGHAHDLYRAEIHDVDRTLGQIVAQLARLHLDDRTLIVLTSDHGEEFLEHGRLGHGSQLFDETTHVPLIIAGPGVPIGQRRGGVFENRHLASTVLDLLGCEAASNLVGPNILKADASGNSALLSTFLGDWRGGGKRDIYGIRDDEWLYIYGIERNGTKRNEALFAGQDVLESENVVKSEFVRAQQYREQIETWVRESKALRPVSFGSDSDTLDMLKLFGYADSPGDE